MWGFWTGPSREQFASRYNAAMQDDAASLAFLRKVADFGNDAKPRWNTIGQPSHLLITQKRTPDLPEYQHHVACPRSLSSEPNRCHHCHHTSSLDSSVSTPQPCIISPNYHLPAVGLRIHGACVFERRHRWTISKHLDVNNCTLLSSHLAFLSPRFLSPLFYH